VRSETGIRRAGGRKMTQTDSGGSSRKNDGGRIACSSILMVRG
jgi:hypothetical protein